MMLSAMRPAAAGSGRPGTMMANSSPPRRASIWSSWSTPATQRATDLQQRVAGGMAEQVVDLLEAVEVDAQQRHWPPPAASHRDLAVELAVEAAAVGQPGQRIVLGEVAQIGFRLLARADVADGDRLPRLVGEDHRACHKLDWDHGAFGLAQDGLDHFARMAKQLRSQRFVGKEGRQERARDQFLGDAGEIGKTAVGRHDRLAVAHDKPFGGGIGEAAHAVLLLLHPPPVANVECKAAAGEQQDGQAGERHRDGEPAGRDRGFGTTILGSGMIEAAPIAVK